MVYHSSLSSMIIFYLRLSHSCVLYTNEWDHSSCISQCRPLLQLCWDLWQTVSPFTLLLLSIHLNRFSLTQPLTCPYDGNRNDSCACNDDGDANAGFTQFTKIRVDLHNRKINSQFPLSSFLSFLLLFQSMISHSPLQYRVFLSRMQLLETVIVWEIVHR